MSTIPPPGIRPRPPMTLADIAHAAAAVLETATAAGLTPPSTLNCQGYGPPAATLYLPSADTPAGAWDALSQWAGHYHADLTTRPGTHPGYAHATAIFTVGRVRYEISTIIKDDEQQPAQEETRP
jgi:hypothetical protein